MEKMSLIVEVNTFAVISTALLALLAYLVHHGSSYLRKKILRAINKEPSDARQLKLEISDLLKELGTLNIVEDFVKYSRIQRKIGEKRKTLNEFESTFQSSRRSLWLKVTIFLIFCQIALHGTGAILTHGSRLIVLNSTVWGPLLWLLSIPFGDKGEVSPVVWMLICRQSFSTVTRLLASRH